MPRGRKKISTTQPISTDETVENKDMHNVKNDDNHVKIVLSWRDNKQRSRTTSYTMADINVHESVTETFSGANKKTRLFLNIEGTVLEKI